MTSKLLLNLQYRQARRAWSLDSPVQTAKAEKYTRRLSSALLKADWTSAAYQVGELLGQCVPGNRCGSPYCEVCRGKWQEKARKEVQPLLHGPDSGLRAFTVNVAVFGPGTPQRMVQHTLSATKKHLKNELDKRRDTGNTRVMVAFEFAPETVSEKTNRKCGLILPEAGTQGVMFHMHGLVQLGDMPERAFRELLRKWSVRGGGSVRVQALRADRSVQENLERFWMYSRKILPDFKQCDCPVTAMINTVEFTEMIRGAGMVGLKWGYGVRC
ncbi:hypothetical protein [Pacificispira sp.]|uniref:hypothetical protein n=1 Tax=Pacificispira sp. TaxID=2888761 RepID=UPI003BA9C39D